MFVNNCRGRPEFDNSLIILYSRCNSTMVIDNLIDKIKYEIILKK